MIAGAPLRGGTALVRDTRRLADTLIFGPSGWLLAIILLWVLVDPLVHGSVWGRVSSDLVATLMILLAAHAASAAYDVRATAFTLAVVASVATWVDHASATRASAIVECAALAVTFGFVVVELVLFVLMGGITVGRIQAALSAYLLTAFMFASLYGIVGVLAPGAFSMAVLDHGGRVDLSTLVYFSVSTMSSTGFGDIVPVAGFARALTILEQIAGLSFVAILIARLHGAPRD
jgi:hypothetical protein